MIVLVVCAAAELRRVTVLMRHGTKVPDAGIVSLCPSYGTLLDAFRSLSTRPGSLTPSGVAQCHAMGQWARTCYAGHSGLLPEDYDPQSFAFISQRSGLAAAARAGAPHIRLHAASAPPYRLLRRVDRRLCQRLFRGARRRTLRESTGRADRRPLPRAGDRRAPQLPGRPLQERV